MCQDTLQKTRRSNLLEGGKRHECRFSCRPPAQIPRYARNDSGFAYTLIMFAELLLKWPLMRQLRDRSDGTGADAMSDATRALASKNRDAKVARSICPYCGVGCGQLIYHRDGEIISVEGDPESPISRGHLCPKGAATFELVTHPARAKKVKYRAPPSREWIDMSVAEAMELVAERLGESSQQAFDQKSMHTTGIAHLGGATLDIEENYLIKKLFRSEEHTSE